MRKDDRIRFLHMLEAAKEAMGFTKNKTEVDLSRDRMLILSVVKDIEIIGEAASKISKECQDQYPEIPWPRIIGMRNRLIHVYFDIDFRQVWQTLATDLPELVGQLEKIIKNFP